MELIRSKKNFQPKGNELSALDAVNNQIELLLQANSSPNGYFDVMYCGGRTTEEIRDHQRQMVQQKVSKLTFAMAKKKMEGLKNWDACCQEALQKGHPLGLVPRF